MVLLGGGGSGLLLNGLALGLRSDDADLGVGSGLSELFRSKGGLALLDGPSHVAVRPST